MPCGPTDHGHRSPAPDMTIYGQYWIDHQTLIWPYMVNILCRSCIGHIWAIHNLYISHVQPTYSTGHTWTIRNIQKMGGRRQSHSQPFLYIYHGPSLACTVGCTGLMYSLCMAHVWSTCDLYIAYITFYFHI